MLSGDDKPEARGVDVTSPYDQQKFWEMLKNSFKNNVAQERAFTKYQPVKKHKGTKRGQPRQTRQTGLQYLIVVFTVFV